MAFKHGFIKVFNNSSLQSFKEIPIPVFEHSPRHLSETHFILDHTFTRVSDFATFARSPRPSSTAPARNRISTFSTSGLASTTRSSYSTIDALDFRSSTTGTGNRRTHSRRLVRPLRTSLCSCSFSRNSRQKSSRRIWD